MKTLDKNEEADFRVAIEKEVSFTREQYEEKREQLKMSIVHYDQFIMNVAESCYENEGTIEDAVYIANDAYSKL